MKDKKVNKKLLLIIFGIILFIALGSTVAYFVWSSTGVDKDVSLSVTSVDPTNSVCQKISDNNPKLIPVSNKNNGRVVRLNAKQTLSEYAYITWTLTISSINKPGTEGNGLKHQTFRYEMVNSTTGKSYGTGNFEGVEEGDTITFSNNTENLAYNKNYTFILYLWIDGELARNPLDMTDQTYSFNLVCDITGEGTNKVQNRAQTAAEYITNLYTSAPKSTATNNEITYNLAPAVNLMNDRKGGTTKDLDGGDIRYYGGNPNNYVWLGDTFTTDYTYTSNGESLTRTAGSKKLWRIIGVFDGRLKLITADPIYNGGLSWDTSANETGGNNGSGINEWGPSGSYEGADLMRLLNEGYPGINGSLYWNKSTGTVYTRSNNATTADVSFANTGLSSSEKNLIDSVTWYLGAYNGNGSYVNIQYDAERQSSTLGKICSSGNYCNDEVTRTAMWNGKVGLMYPSDYGYAVDLSLCTKKIGYTNYPEDGTGFSDDTNCKTNNWLYNSSYGQWTISPHANSSYAFSVFNVNSGGYLNGSDAHNGNRVVPAVYLKPEVLIDTSNGKNGSENSPYTLYLNN